MSSNLGCMDTFVFFVTHTFIRLPEKQSKLLTIPQTQDVMALLTIKLSLLTDNFHLRKRIEVRFGLKLRKYYA